MGCILKVKNTRWEPSIFYSTNHKDEKYILDECNFREWTDIFIEIKKTMLNLYIIEISKVYQLVCQLI